MVSQFAWSVHFVVADFFNDQFQYGSYDPAPNQSADNRDQPFAESVLQRATSRRI